MRLVSLWLSSPCFNEEDVCFLQRKAQSVVTLEENKTQGQTGVFYMSA